MNNVTLEQKETFIALAEKYDKNVAQILKRGTGTEILIDSTTEAQSLEAFANNVCAKVLKDFPDYAGKDEDVNSDAALIANIIPRLVLQFNNTRNPN